LEADLFPSSLSEESKNILCEQSVLFHLCVEAFSIVIKKIVEIKNIAQSISSFKVME
jgi:hypothetical protein